MQARIVIHLYNRAQGMLQGIWQDYAEARTELETLEESLAAGDPISLQMDRKGVVLIPPEEARHALFFLDTSHSE